MKLTKAMEFMRLFSRADILQAVQKVPKCHRSSIRPCGAEAAINLSGYRVTVHEVAKDL